MPRYEEMPHPSSPETAKDVADILVDQGVVERDGTSRILSVLEKNEPEVTLEVLQEVNAALRGSNTDDSTPFSRQLYMMSKPDVTGRKSGLSFVFPSPEDSREIALETLAKVRDVAAEKTPESQQRISRTLYNLMMFDHPFPDGNGRLGRVLYYLTSPRINRSQAGSDLQRIVLNRGKSVFRYIEIVKHAQFASMAEDLGYNTEIDEDARDFHSRVEGAGLTDFDRRFMQALTAMQFMTKAEQARYNLSKEPNGFVINDSVLPKEITSRIEEKLPTVRAKFVRGLMEWSISKEGEFPDELLEPLEKDLVA